MSSVLVMQAVLVATIGTAVAGGILAWRERPEPGAIPLTAFLVGVCWWSATLLFKINAATLPAKIFWENVSWIGVALIPVAWLFFCLSYTGYTDYLEREYVVAAGILPVATAVFALTNGYHGLLFTDPTLVERNGYLVLSLTPGVWWWVTAAYTYLLGLLGAIPLVRFITSKVSTFRGQSLALLIGLVVPWTANVLYLLNLLPTGGIDPTPVAFSVSAVAFLGALTRFQLFDTSPAPIHPARQQVFDRMEGGVIVLDRRNTVVDMNSRAAAALGTAVDDPLGRDIRAVSEQFGRLVGERARSESAVFRPGDDMETYDVSVADLTDGRGRTIGRIMTLYDISEYLRQQQRLEVLNRIFRHNIRTNSQVMLGHVEYLAEHNSPERVEQARERIEEITAFSDAIRTILDIFEQGRKESVPADVGRIIEEQVAAVRDGYPDVTVHDVDPPTDIYVDSIAEEVVANVVENAAQHNTNATPEVWVDAAVDDDSVEITVRDNGPGIPDEELALLKEGTESPLNHGTGHGLALVIWGTEIIDGHISIEDRDPAGTEVTVTIPVIRSAASA